ncbi:MAG: EF-P lysine aminoacylase GenX [Leptonema sp. (in: Bacteria)]|nr:EF-P lysine aminoacylase GenX [Leptonema sp. (in: bacteria)]
MRPLQREIILLRSAFLKKVRQFFDNEGCIEVETPILHSTGCTEPFIENLKVTDPTDNSAAFLITSPESHLKSILAEVNQPIFQIAHVFRGGDGSHQSHTIHTREFLMLEWYVPYFTEFDLMSQIERFINYMAQPFSQRPKQGLRIQILKIKNLMNQYANCGFDRQSLETAAIELKLATKAEVKADRYDELFYRVFLTQIEPRLTELNEPIFVYGYPKELAAYSKTENDIARRFELYWHGVELANGYFELTDPKEQRRRFEAENLIRKSIGKEERSIDTGFLAALEKGLPRCAGVALGIDRLLMVLAGETRLSKVSPFL